MPHTPGDTAYDATDPQQPTTDGGDQSKMRPQSLWFHRGCRTIDGGGTHGSRLPGSARMAGDRHAANAVGLHEPCDCMSRVTALAAEDQPQARERAQGECDALEPDLIHSPKRGDSEQRTYDQGRDEPQADE